MHVPDINTGPISSKVSSLRWALSPGLGEGETKALKMWTVADRVGYKIHAPGTLQANKILPTEYANSVLVTVCNLPQYSAVH